ncbi:hypothetical protein ACOME3_000008 [Neoechinorhynchus agilis]
MRYVRYLTSSKPRRYGPVSEAKTKGLRMINLARGSNLTFRTIAYFVFENPNQWRRVQQRIIENFTSDNARFQSIHESILDANMTLPDTMEQVRNEVVTSDEFNCDFVVHSSKTSEPKRIRCNKVCVRSYNVWQGAYGCLPCTRRHGLNSAQKREIDRKRLRALYFNNTSRLAGELFRRTKSRQCHLKPSVIDHHFNGLFGPGEGPVKTDCHSEAPASFPTVTVEEIGAAFKGIKASTAAGPDGITIRDLSRMDPGYAGMCIIFNCILSCGYSPKALNGGKTILVPKSSSSDKNLNDIKGWRPITICSILQRVLHRILLARLRKEIKLAPGQTAFDSAGCLANLLTLKSALR